MDFHKIFSQKKINYLILNAETIILYKSFNYRKVYRGLRRANYFNFSKLKPLIQWPWVLKCQK
jgi:hypothetical protein